MNAEKKMEPCPFCNERPTRENVMEASSSLAWVQCFNAECGAEGPVRDTINEAIKAWNRRAS